MLLELELLHLQFAFGGKGIAPSRQTRVRDMRWRCARVPSYLDFVPELLLLMLIQKLLLDTLLKLQLLKTLSIGRGEVGTVAQRLPQVEIQCVLLLLDLKLVALRSAAREIGRSGGCAEHECE
jgi:hypothetical protein